MSVPKILDKIIKPELRAKFNDWQQYAKSVDVFGLECINEIYNSKGNKKLKLPLPNLEKQKQYTETKSSFLGETSGNLQVFFNEESQHRQLILSIMAALQRPNQRTPQKISRPLNPMTITFIDNWISLKDSLSYEEPVLNCLRSLHSKLLTTQPNNTEAKTKYDWKNDYKLSKPIRMDKVGEDLFTYKPNLQAIQKQQRKKQLHLAKMKQLHTEEFRAQMRIFKDFKIN